MNIKPVTTKRDIKKFYDFSSKVYKELPNHRSTEDDITRLIVQGPSVFHTHASVRPFLLQHNDRIVGRFVLVHDRKLPNFVQVSFFEAYSGLPDIVETIRAHSKILFPACRRMVWGLNGHLNYGAGFLLNKFDEPPIFGLPYTPAYYVNYFKELDMKEMVSFRFPLQAFIDYHKSISTRARFDGITVRKMNKKNLLHETKIYTYLNNACFPGHPYWADRDIQEDFELFSPFRFLLKEENLLFAEMNGEPIGFFLWYPDFNQLVKGDESLGVRHALRYHLVNPIDTFRFTEIAVLPRYNISPAVQAMILKATPLIQKTGVKYGEGGFIFEENKRSMAMTRRFLERATGKKMQPYRRYAVFENDL
ncbi:MAG: hypothetical protein EHM72_11020 [Calditrichaeota bacterium]|nr:MAG: hypothetical protein EHM72_11020 [Calditrichota bacterium]